MKSDGKCFLYCLVLLLLLWCVDRQKVLHRPVSDSPTVFSLARRLISLAFLAQRAWLCLSHYVLAWSPQLAHIGSYYTGLLMYSFLTSFSYSLYSLIGIVLRRFITYKWIKIKEINNSNFSKFSVVNFVSSPNSSDRLVYRVFQKKDTQFYFWDNFGNSAPILTILSLLQAEIYGA